MEALQRNPIGQTGKECLTLFDIFLFQLNAFVQYEESSSLNGRLLKHHKSMLFKHCGFMMSHMTYEESILLVGVTHNPELVLEYKLRSLMFSAATGHKWQ